jgi:hypothetical protein
LLLLERTAPADDRLISPDLGTAAEGTLWFDVRTIGVEGQGWSEDQLASPFDRLPARAEGIVRDDVWNLSRHSAGICVRFETDATTIHAKWNLTSDRLEMQHMPATGVSGLDLYARDDEGAWRWLACAAPSAQENAATLCSDIIPGPREYLLYLPLYNGVTEVAIGIPESSSLFKAPAYAAGHEKPIVFYGTSITHGACASRPGMVHTAILGRWFERPVINLGFSGNGRLETEFVQYMAEIDAAVFVLDCLPNLGAEDVAARTEPVVRMIREHHPDTPILLVEDRTYSDALFVPGKRERNDTSRAAFRAAYERLVADGVENLHYLEGEHLLGEDNEGTVDSSHPTDLGFLRQAEAFREVLEPLLE